MKLSSLNRFKNKEVSIEFEDKKGGGIVELKGLLENIEPQFITVDYSQGLRKIEISQLVLIEEIKDEITKKIEKKEIDLGNCVGIRIWKGNPATDKNIEATLENSIDFSNIELINDKEIINKLNKLKELREPIHLWAGIKGIQKRLRYGDKIIFVLVNKKDAFIFEYLDEVRDSNFLIHKYVGWNYPQTEGGADEVVFLKKIKKITLSDSEMMEILRLTNAKDKGFGPFIGYPSVLSEIQIQRLEEIFSSAELFNFFD